MPNQSSNSETFVVQNCILSYPHLFQPQQVNGQGDPKYSAALLVDEATAGMVYAKAQELAAAHFKNNEAALPNFSWPVIPASSKPNYASNPRLASLYIVNAKASADFPPQIVDGNRQPVMDRGQIYAGCVVAAGIRLYTYNNMGNIGIGVGLSAVMKMGDGEALGGEAVDANTLFGGVQAQAPAGMPGAPAGMPGAPVGMPVQAPAPVGMPGAPVGMPGAPAGYPGGAPAPATPPGNFGTPTAPAAEGMPAQPFPGQPTIPPQS